MAGLTVGSLFSGCGLMDSGLEDAGLCVLWQCEIDAEARRVLAHHRPNVRCHENVRDLHSKEYLDNSVRTLLECFGVRLETEDIPVKYQPLRKLTIGQAEESVRMYEAGLSLAPIAEYFGVSRQSMWDLLRRRTKMRPQKRSGTDNHFFRGGATSDEIAHNLVETAVQQGVLKRPESCEECHGKGSFKDRRSKIQAHHDDYNKPLDVRWLCQECHHKWHKHNKAKRKEVPSELAQVDVICGGFP